ADDRNRRLRPAAPAREDGRGSRGAPRRSSLSRVAKEAAPGSGATSFRSSLLNAAEPHAEHERAVAAEEAELDVRLARLKRAEAVLRMADGERVDMPRSVADDLCSRMALRPRSRDGAALLLLEGRI